MKICNLFWVTCLLIVVLPCAVQAADNPQTKNQHPTNVAQKTQTALKTKINPTDGAKMVCVPAGAFTMGSGNADQYANANEKPAHTVRLSGYWIYKNDVTVAQYKKFCAATKHKMPEAPDWGWIDTHPMVNVNWYAAQAYCACVTVHVKLTH